MIPVIQVVDDIILVILRFESARVQNGSLKIGGKCSAFPLPAAGHIEKVASGQVQAGQINAR